MRLSESDRLSWEGKVLSDYLEAEDKTIQQEELRLWETPKTKQIDHP
jgi:hypothetical protein